MSNDECLINDEAQMSNDETEAALESEMLFRHSSFVIRH
jgi:hypothetical protein